MKLLVTSDVVKSWGSKVEQRSTSRFAPGKWRSTRMAARARRRAGQSQMSSVRRWVRESDFSPFFWSSKVTVTNSVRL